MGRSRKRQRRETGSNGEAPLSGSTQFLSPVVSPVYVPMRDPAERPAMDAPGAAVPEVDARVALLAAPVLPLDGLEPWAEIPGPALAVEDVSPDGAASLTFTHPDQLELEPWAPAHDAVRAEVEALTEAVLQAAAGVVPPEPAVAEAPAAEVVPPPAPDPAETLYAEARAAAEAGRATEALVLYRHLLTRFPQHLRARNNLALVLDALGEHAGALAELDRALEMDPEHTTLLTNRGALLGAQGRYAAAERDLRRVLRVEPANVEALFNLGVVMTKKGLWGEAVPHLRHVTVLDPERGPAFYYLGEALNHVDDLLGALGAYQRATELQPGNARALYGLGIIYDRLARPDDAALMYRKSREVARR